MELSDYVGASCCVNISGSCSDIWDGPHKENLIAQTFDRIVAITQNIIDEVKPKYTCYSLEPMPWMYPDSTQTYLDLINNINCEDFCVHFDFVNVINSVEKYYNNDVVIKEWFEKLSPYAKSCHVKDIIIGNELTLHLNECRPGTGNMDFNTIIESAQKMDDDFCVMLEHMESKSDYAKSMVFLNSIIN